MQRCRQNPSPRLQRKFASFAGVVFYVLASATAAAQAIYTSTDSRGHMSFSDRADAAQANFKQDAADALSREQSATAVTREHSRISTARARAIDRKEAERRLRVAQRDLARGPDMQQGIPPVAENIAGQRRRERAQSLQNSVTDAQARVRELEEPGTTAPKETNPNPIVAQR